MSFIAANERKAKGLEGLEEPKPMLFIRIPSHVLDGISKSFEEKTKDMTKEEVEARKYEILRDVLREYFEGNGFQFSELDYPLTMSKFLGDKKGDCNDYACFVYLVIEALNEKEDFPVKFNPEVFVVRGIEAEESKGFAHAFTVCVIEKDKEYVVFDFTMDKQNIREKEGWSLGVYLFSGTRGELATTHVVNMNKFHGKIKYSIDKELYPYLFKTKNVLLGFYFAEFGVYYFNNGHYLSAYLAYRTALELGFGSEYAMRKCLESVLRSMVSDRYERVAGLYEEWIRDEYLREKLLGDGEALWIVGKSYLSLGDYENCLKTIESIPQDKISYQLAIEMLAFILEMVDKVPTEYGPKVRKIAEKVYLRADIINSMSTEKAYIHKELFASILQYGGDYKEAFDILSMLGFEKISTDHGLVSYFVCGVNIYQNLNESEKNGFKTMIKQNFSKLDREDQKTLLDACKGLEELLK